MKPVPGNPRSAGDEGRVALGAVTGAFGIQGWIKLVSYTRPAEAILDYPRWHIQGQVWDVRDGRPQGESVVARLQGLQDRDAAMALRGATIEVDRSELPQAAPGQYYWADLIGCEVESAEGAKLGRVESLYSNGAQDVMVVEGERQRLIPFVAGPIVQAVDVAAKRIVVDWQPEY